MDLSNLRPADGSKHSDNFRRGRGHVLEMVRQLVKVTKVRRLVPEQQDQALKVVRCLYTEEYQREDSNAETLRNRWYQCKCIREI